jgi:DNA-directed RNA polymerase subunit F
MSAPKVLEEEPITMSEMKLELSRIKRRDGELNYRANKTEDYLNQFVSLSGKKAEELTKKLQELEIPRLKDLHIKKIVDILPATPEDVKIALEAYPITVNAENIKKIVSTVEEYL